MRRKADWLDRFCVQQRERIELTTAPALARVIQRRHAAIRAANESWEEFAHGFQGCDLRYFEGRLNRWEES